MGGVELLLGELPVHVGRHRRSGRPECPKTGHLPHLQSPRRRCFESVAGRNYGGLAGIYYWTLGAGSRREALHAEQHQIRWHLCAGRRPDQFRPRENGRNIRYLDPGANRNQGAANCRAHPDHHGSGRGGCPKRAGRGRPAARGHRPDRARHLDAGLVLPVRRLPGPAAAGRARSGLRRAGRLHRVPVRHRHCRSLRQQRAGAPGPGDRCRNPDQDY